MFLQGCWVESRTRPLVIRLPGHGVDALQEMLRQGFIFHPLLPFPIDWQPWETEPAVEVGGVQVTVQPTTHLDRLRHDYPAQMPAGAASYAFTFQRQGIQVVHSGDLGAARDLTPLLREPVNLLVCELAHFPAEALFARLQDAQVHRLLLVHLSHECWAARETILRTARKRLPNTQIQIPEEGFTTTF